MFRVCSDAQKVFWFSTQLLMLGDFAIRGRVSQLPVCFIYLYIYIYIYIYIDWCSDAFRFSTDSRCSATSRRCAILQWHVYLRLPRQWYREPTHLQQQAWPLLIERLHVAGGCFSPGRFLWLSQIRLLQCKRVAMGHHCISIFVLCSNI